ncbi:MAG: hypothetical protein JWP80_2754 [Pseudomonas sp.]|nr:hypothetical protein [Pseudomonas sp.]
MANPKFPGSGQSPDPARPAPVDKPDEASEDENPPPQDWKHPDDGKSLSDRDEERPLKP